MRLGELGCQIVLVSPKAFDHIRFTGFEEAPPDIYYPLRLKRDDLARSAYFSCRNDAEFSPEDLYVVDIMRNEMKSNDPRLR